MKNDFKKLSTIILLLLFPLISLAGSLSDYAENTFVDHILRGSSYSATTPTNYYVALYSTACTDASAGTELTGGSYARVAIARSASAWNGTHGNTAGASSGTNGTVSNAAAVTFPAATADWGTATHWGIVDASSGGNMITCAALTANRTITNGSTASFAAGALTFQIDD